MIMRATHAMRRVLGIGATLRIGAALRTGTARSAAAAATFRAVSVLALGALALNGCAHAPLSETGNLAWQQPPAANTTTVGLWRFDETTGLEFTDSGSTRRDGILGIDTRTEFGRFHNARAFTPSLNSFAMVPAARAPQLGDSWTIEAWIRPTVYGPVECNTIAGEWTSLPEEQSWMLGLTGFNRTVIPEAPARPDWFDNAIRRRGVGLLVFVLQPREASDVLAFESTQPIELNRWTHIAVTQDHQELRMVIDGRLDAQYATGARVRPSATPLVIGNLIDARWLTSSQGAPRVPSDSQEFPFYAFEGVIDELRISDMALSTGAH